MGATGHMLNNDITPFSCQDRGLPFSSQIPKTSWAWAVIEYGDIQMYMSGTFAYVGMVTYRCRFQVHWHMLAW
jgi:hypothetical protein